MKAIVRLYFLAAVLLLLAGCGGSLALYHGDDGGGEASPDGTGGDVAWDVPLDPQGEEEVAPGDALPEEDDAPDAAPDLPVEPGCGAVQLPFEARAMARDEGMVVRNSSRPEIGTYVVTWWDEYGTGAMSIEIPCEDDWVLWAQVWWEDMYSDSFYWAWDDPDGVAVWHVMQQCETRVDADWYWDQVSRSPVTDYCDIIDEDPAVVHLGAGSHTFFLKGRESGSAVARFVLTNDRSWQP